jgi:hypothetical protein
MLVSYQLLRVEKAAKVWDDMHADSTSSDLRQKLGTEDLHTKFVLKALVRLSIRHWSCSPWTGAVQCMTIPRPISLHRCPAS